MTANNSKPYLPYLNKFVDKYNNTYHESIRIKKETINSDYSASIENIESNPQAPKFKLNDKVIITKYKNIFLVKVVLKTGQEKYLLSFCFEN